MEMVALPKLAANTNVSPLAAVAAGDADAVCVGVAACAGSLVAACVFVAALAAATVVGVAAGDVTLEGFELVSAVVASAVESFVEPANCDSPAGVLL